MSSLNSPTPPLEYMRQALALARQSPPRAANFCVGALLVDPATDRVLATGYTLELPGNTHAEQCCFRKAAAAAAASAASTSTLASTLGSRAASPPEQAAEAIWSAENKIDNPIHLDQLKNDDLEDQYLPQALPPGTVLYTTLEPCVQRSPGNRSCVERILRSRRNEHGGGVATVYCGLREPPTFVAQNTASEQLTAAGIHVCLVPGLEEEIRSVATAGHVQTGTEAES